MMTAPPPLMLSKKSGSGSRIKGRQRVKSLLQSGGYELTANTVRAHQVEVWQVLFERFALLRLHEIPRHDDGV